MTKSKMTIDISKVVMYDEESFPNSCIAYPGFESRVHKLFYVCTGRMVEGLYGSYEGVKSELEAWIELLTCDYSNIMHPAREEGVGCVEEWGGICYKPQILIAITNNRQARAIEALLAVGFKPSEPVNNAKYGEDSNLINWTYALNPIKEEGEGSSVD